MIWISLQFINATIRLYSPIRASNGTSVKDDVQHSSFAQWQTMYDVHVLVELIWREGKGRLNVEYRESWNRILEY